MAGMFYSFLLTVVASSLVEDGNSSKPLEPPFAIWTSGDIVIAGLSPIHYPLGAKDDHLQLTTKEGNCNGHLNFQGLQYAEAILYAVDRINEDPHILPGITLGVDIRDTCNSVDHAIRETLQFSFVQEAYNKGDSTNTGCSTRGFDSKPNGKTVAIVGAAYSGITMAVTSLAGLFYVPVVSYASTSRLLGDQARFKYFLRTVPSDTLQAQAMVDIIQRFEWNFVSVIASDTEYGRSGIEAFKTSASKLSNYSICIAVDALFTTRTPKHHLQKIIRKLHRQPKARVIVLFAELNDAEYFIKTAKEENLGDKIWIGSDAFSQSYRVLDGNEDILKYWIATSPVARVYKPFMDYYLNITRERMQRNPWLSRYKQVLAKHMNSSKRMEFSTYTTTAIDAVYAIAHGLDEMFKCKQGRCPRNATKINQNRDLFDLIKNVTFDSPTGNHISFDANGSAGSRYVITFTEKDQASGQAVFRVLGDWSTKPGLNTVLNIYNRSLGNLFQKANIDSSCSASCHQGSRKIPRNKFPECCWRCSRCQGDSVTNSSGMTACRACPPGTRANKGKSFCDVIQPTAIVMTTAGRTVIGASGLGILAVFATFFVFFCHRHSAVVRASSKELSYVILCGIACNLTNATVIIAPPTLLLCQLRPFLASTGMSSVIGSLLSKTNRISRIFSLKTMRTGKTHFVSNKWQLAFVFVCMLLGNVVAAVWNVISLFEVVTVPHGRAEVTIECSQMSGDGFAAWAAYHVGLTVLCTYQAFLVRKVPENYNEAKFIAFTMVTLCISVTVYVPTYYGTYGVYRAILTASLYIFCSYATFGCLFGPKLYIILFRPEKNRPLAPRLESGESTKQLYSRANSAATVTNSSPMGTQNYAPSYYGYGGE